MTVQAVLDGVGLMTASAEKIYDDVAESLLCSHLEVEVAGLRAGFHVPSNSPRSSLAVSAAAPEVQWALQECRCLVKLMSSHLAVLSSKFWVVQKFTTIILGVDYTFSSGLAST